MKKYKTKDFYLSSLLVANNIKLIDTKRKNENTIYFIFEVDNMNKVNNIVNEFVNCEAMVNVKKFTKSINVIRNVMRNTK